MSWLLAFVLQTSSTCDVPRAVGDTMQVAWVSPVPQQVGANAMMNVVRTSELRSLAIQRGRDAARVLRAMGLLGTKQELRKDYKIVLFDVKTEWLCRPVPGAEEEKVAGLRRCSEGDQHRGWSIRSKAWSDCGYLLDMVSGIRTLDLYRVSWKDAATWGFCVMPLERFLEGA